MKKDDLVLNPDKINIPGKVFYKEITESTNLDAKRAENVPDKSIFLAELQTAGRGRLGRNWSSPKGCGIWMSIYLKPEAAVTDISQLTLIAGLAVSRIIENSEIKWPNDVILSKRKVGGILTETTLEGGTFKHIVVGIGINVNNEEFPEELCDIATSLYLETGKKYIREDLISKIAKEFFDMYARCRCDGFSVFKDEYASKCTTLNNEVYVINGEEKRVAKAVGITNNGELIIETNGKREIINSCEVSVRGLLGYA